MKQDHQYKHTIKNLYATREDQQIKFSRFVSKRKFLRLNLSLERNNMNISEHLLRNGYSD